METTSPLVLPCGYVFAPTDSELLGYFLFSKIQNPTVQFEEIKDPKNIYEYVPDILTSLYERNSRANEWYFFSRVNKKHGNGSRLSRSIAGQKGFWRASTGVKKVRRYNGQLLGKRTPLNYYEGKNSKTDWIMQEYILAPPQDHRTPNKFEDYALCKIYQKGSKASTSKSSIVIGHQLREISYNFNSVCAKEGLEEDYMVPQVPYYDQYINVGEAQGGTINSEEAMLPLMIVNQGHPSALVPFVPTDDNVANMGSVNNIASTSINCSSDHHDVQDVHVNSFSSDFCDIDTHPDVVALPNVESMVETTEVLEEQEGVDWLRPILLEDYHLVEKLANFDRERIPERVVHDRGASAKGFFEVTHDISQLSCADFLRAPGVQTPLIVRFSTVIHERGSPETLRDPRVIVLKSVLQICKASIFLSFVLHLGNFDLVGNNFPVFFIRDGMKFPDMVHALKPNPKSHIQENWRVLDFFSHHPESLHMFTFLFDDIDQPAGSNHSRATQDLYDSIAAGNYPEWKLFIQIIDLDHEDKFDFDPLDVTKTWPEDILPLMCHYDYAVAVVEGDLKRHRIESPRNQHVLRMQVMSPRYTMRHPSKCLRHAHRRKEIEVHKSQVTTAETSSSDSIEEEQDESQEQEVDGEEAEQSK
ncbi:hypothetical protein Sjap_017511 [Stephania japonica]|uniref:catalase n=1 Tax=Stephania japonica TaxID=461633 RepID=A0AAP0NM29_9MAGN